jgi:hypothetical protein
MRLQREKTVKWYDFNNLPLQHDDQSENAKPVQGLKQNSNSESDSLLNK